jgi:squalene-hopene/tetraprenyl-beta-curcumene cyclase
MPAPTIDPAAVDPAIARAHEFLRARQKPDGAWPGGTIAGPDATAEAVIGLSFAGALAPADARKAARAMLGYQLDDGSFSPYAGGPGTLDETAIVYAALLRAGEAPDSPGCARARAYIDAHGGLGRAGSFAQLLLVAAGLVDPQALQSMPVAWVMIPGVARALGTRFTPAYTLMFMMLPALIRALKRGEPAAKGSAEACEEARVCHYIRTHQNPTGNLFAAVNTTVMAILTYVALGVSPAEDRLRRMIADMAQWRRETDDTLEFVVFDSTVWNTSLVIAALRGAGVPHDDPAVVRGVEYMLDRQSFWPLPRDWQNPTPCTPRTGGWPFEDRNPLAADCDSTSEVLQALGHMPRPGGCRCEHAVRAGLKWLYGMQNADGGWPAFSRGHTSKPPGPFPITEAATPTGIVDLIKFMLDVPVQLGDPSTEDLTGRVLQGLGQLGVRADHPRVAAAIRFLRGQVASNGAWWGRWECNYLAGTAEVIQGLAMVGADLRDPVFAGAIQWMLARQNPDGGWGETVDSYADPTLAGTGETNQYLTGIVTTALVAAGHARSEAVARAVDHLLRAQKPHGDWDGGPFQFTVSWPWPFYQLETTATIYPLRALTAYRNATRG